MHKYLIAALLIAAGCDATRRDFKYCNAKYNQCDKGYTCNLTTELCEPDAVDAPVDRIQPSEVTPPLDVTPGEVAADTRDAPVIDVTPGEVGAIDGARADVPIGVDVALPDTRVPDAAGTCAGDSDCTGVGATVCVNFRCVACRTNAQCGGTTPFCSPTNTCVSCASAPGDAGVCSGTTPVCDHASGRCVECTQNNECKSNASKSFCVANQCQGCNVPGATASTGSADGGVADGGAVDAGVVGPCLGATPICATTGSLTGQCVQCLSSTDCSGPTPICGTNNTCEKCTTDKQCADKGGGPGVCMYHDDGRCALDQETLYVQNSSGCTGGTGTVASPFCRPQDAANAITSSRRLLVLTGGTALAEFVVSRNDSLVVSIIGRQNPLIGVGAANKGVHVQKGRVYIRGLKIQGAGGDIAAEPGIVVESGATLAMDRCYVVKNKGGLLVRNGAGFDIANSVFAENGSGDDGGSSVFGGVYLGTVGSGLPNRFWFNTVVWNGQFGVVCNASPQQRLESVLLANNTGGNVVKCSVSQTSGADNLAPNGSGEAGFSTTSADFMLDTNYHLTSRSPTNSTQLLPCRDWISPTATNHPPFDVDGDPRPYPGTGKLDCGADEYRP